MYGGTDTWSVWKLHRRVSRRAQHCSSSGIAAQRHHWHDERKIAGAQLLQQQQHHRQAAAAAEAAAAPTAAAAATFAAQHQENKFGVGATTFPFTLSLQIQTSQASKGLIFNFRIRRTLRASSQVVVGLANRDCPPICASRPGTAYISAAWRNGSDLTAGHPFPVVLTERFPVPSTSLSNPCDGRPARSFICGRQSCGTTS